MTPVLRSATLDDVDAVLASWRSAAEDTGRGHAAGYGPQPAWRRWVEPL